jgi:two-component system, NarL family, response regulator NreC
MNTSIKEIERTGMRILILDDQKIMREGLCSLLGKLPDIEMVAEAENPVQALKLINEFALDVVIIDMTPSLNGVEAARRILSGQRSVNLIALSIYSDRQFVVEMLRAGVSCYLLKDCAFDELNQAIHFAIQGRTYITPRVLDIIVKDYFSKGGKQVSSGLSSLTGRQHKVLQLLAEGKTPGEIAQQMSTSVTTVKAYRQQIEKKLYIGSIAGLTKYAICEGLISVDKQ